MSSTYEDVEISDMDFAVETETFTYPCPCGDLFTITLDELLDGKEIAPCPSCSLLIKVVPTDDELEGFLDLVDEAEGSSGSGEEDDGSGERSEDEGAGEEKEDEENGEEDGEENEKEKENEEKQHARREEERELEPLDGETLRSSNAATAAEAEERAAAGAAKSVPTAAQAINTTIALPTGTQPAYLAETPAATTSS